MSKLLTLGVGNAKISKSDEANSGYLTAIMHLSPYKLSGYNVCPQASPGCIAACLNTAGRGQMNNVQKARLARTKMFFENRDAFKAQLYSEIQSFSNSCIKKGLKPAIRLNGTSDLRWEQIWPDMFVFFNEVQFYDYTKIKNKALNWAEGKLPKNYHITFSRSEVNEKDAIEVLRKGCNVAVVFDKLPKKWKRFNVFNADEDDLRFLSNRGVQGLIAKGKAKKDDTGFVVKV